MCLRLPLDCNCAAMQNHVLLSAVPSAEASLVLVTAQVLKKICMNERTDELISGDTGRVGGSPWEIFSGTAAGNVKLRATMEYQSEVL